MRNSALFLCFVASIAWHSTMRQTYAQEHGHGEHGASAAPTSTKAAPPTVFLDKSPRIVEYQLKRLDNQRLLQVERKTNDAKYIPVHAAILSRVGMSPQYREEALEALIKLRQSDAVSILLEAIGKLDAKNRDEIRTGEQLARMLLSQRVVDLQARIDAILESTEADQPHCFARLPSLLW